jgi:hypothetical protein
LSALKPLYKENNVNENLIYELCRAQTDTKSEQEEITEINVNVTKVSFKYD